MSVTQNPVKIIVLLAEIAIFSEINYRYFLD